MLKKAIVFFLILGFFAAEAVAGPFGLEKGMSLNAIGGKPEQIALGKYKLTDVPTPHSAFEAYIVQIAPKSGLCWVKAIGKDVATSSYGSELKSEFRKMEEKLGSSYGQHKTLDTLLPGSIWNEPNDWMMGLIKKERILAAVWEAKDGSSLPPDLQSIALYASPYAQDKGYISIEYTFINEDACESELAAKEDGAL